VLADGFAGSSITTGWDIAANKKLQRPAPNTTTDTAAVVAVVAPAVSTLAAAAAGITYYMLIDGIDGGSTAKGHEKAFEIDGYSWEVSNSSTTHAGGGAGAGKANFSDLLVGLNLNDRGLPQLLFDAASGTHIKAVTIEGVKDGALHSFYKLELSDVLVKNVADGNDDSDFLSLDFAKFKVTTTAQKADGSAAAPVSTRPRRRLRLIPARWPRRQRASPTIC
jgi:type VI protein secretion system component Hcp